MKTLVIVAHPHMEKSVINKRWVEELRKDPDHVTVHDLYEAYPDGVLDVAREQALIEAHGTLVLQFPIYWFSSPPLLKQWLDEVFLYGWAYGSKGDKLKNRITALAVSAGSSEEEYQTTGRYRRPLEEILSPFATTFLYCGADYRSFYALYGAENEMEASTLWLEQSTRDYLSFLKERASEGTLS
ncbi:NAD(P)H-dependent oxidoreductase [Gorillibacterium sp. CAU 1737]|uniref:NAD(P)H-dependent oxidoreductase n=1 Tax=Gorillibacterium sp. CAU 1737 TaxID=3140362 RepID=UPI0032611BFB